MKPFIQCVSCPALFGWIVRPFAAFIRRHDKYRRGRADLLSDHMLRDIGLHHGTCDDPLYGSARRRW